MHQLFVKISAWYRIMLSCTETEQVEWGLQMYINLFVIRYQNLSIVLWKDGACSNFNYNVSLLMQRLKPC